MITLEELDAAIKECETAAPSYGICSKLATLYTVRYYLYGIRETDRRYLEYDAAEDEGGGDVVGEYGDSEFLKFISGKKSAQAWRTMDELMSTLEIINPRLYHGVMKKLDV